MSGNRAPSLILYHHEKDDGDIVRQDIFVPRHGSAQCTYYCCLCWNAGQNGGGYCGIQDHPDGKCYIFSIWDPHKSADPILPTFKGPGTWTSRFGGEGTGLKSMNFDLGWNPDSWYTFVTRRWSNGKHTMFGLWVHDQTGEKWTHLITMDFPEPDIFFKTTSSFLEDWQGNGHLVRCVKFKDGKKRKTAGGDWCSIRSVKFWVNQEDACKTYNDNFTAYTENGCFFMQSGHQTTPEAGMVTSKELTCECPDGEESHHCPAQPLMSFTATMAIDISGQGTVSWHVPESSTPQFKFTVKVGHQLLVSEVGSETREYKIKLLNATMATVILEDILGREVSKNVEVS